MIPSGPVLETSPPAFVMPPGSCDTHAHIFGPGSEFPFDEGHPFSKDPFDASEEMLSAMHAAIGADRCVIVHGRPHGFDLSVTLAALKKNPDRYRAVVLVNPGDESIDFQTLHDTGVRGVRFNTKGVTPDLDRIGGLLERVAPFGWHVLLHMDNKQIIEFEDFLKSIPVPIVFDHMLRIEPREGLDQAPLAKLKEFLDGGNAYVKLSAFERNSHAPYPYDDILPIASDLMAYAPERCLWATDWPHNYFGTEQPPEDNQMDGPPNDGPIADLIPLFATKSEAQQRLLVGNPAELYGF